MLTQSYLLHNFDAVGSHVPDHLTPSLLQAFGFRDIMLIPSLAEEYQVG